MARTLIPALRPTSQSVGTTTPVSTTPPETPSPPPPGSGVFSNLPFDVSQTPTPPGARASLAYAPVRSSQSLSLPASLASHLKVRTLGQAVADTSQTPQRHLGQQRRHRYWPSMIGSPGPPQLWRQHAPAAHAADWGRTAAAVGMGDFSTRLRLKPSTTFDRRRWLRSRWLSHDAGDGRQRRRSWGRARTARAWRPLHGARPKIIEGSSPPDEAACDPWGAVLALTGAGSSGRGGRTRMAGWAPLAAGRWRRSRRRRGRRAGGADHRRAAALKEPRLGRRFHRVIRRMSIRRAADPVRHPRARRSADGVTVTRRLRAVPLHRVDSSGRLLSWGGGDDGALGHGDTVSRVAPTMVRAFDEAAERVVSVVWLAPGLDERSALFVGVGRVTSWATARLGCLEPTVVEELVGVSPGAIWEHRSRAVTGVTWCWCRAAARDSARGDGGGGGRRAHWMGWTGGGGQADSGHTARRVRVGGDDMATTGWADGRMSCRAVPGA